MIQKFHTRCTDHQKRGNINHWKVYKGINTKYEGEVSTRYIKAEQIGLAMAYS